MQRYSGEHLGSAPHIVVLGSCKVGNFVVSTPVLCGLRARFPDAVIGFIGSEVTLISSDPFGLLTGAAVGTKQALVVVCVCCRIWLTSVNAMALCNWLSILMALIRPYVRLVPWLEPVFVAGGSLSANRRRDLPWGDHPRQRFL